jgi:AcrR family transcriptional regulator
MFEAERTVEPLRARSGDLTRKRILVAAREMFSRYGYDKTTMRQLAGQLAITDSALYYYFPQKRAILCELLEAASGAELGPASQTREGLLEQLLETFYYYANQGELVRMMLREQLCGRDESIQFRRTFNENYYAVYGPPLLSLYGPDGMLILEAIMFMLSGVIWEAVLSYGDDIDEVVSQAAFQARVRGLLELALPPEPHR